MLVKSPLIYQGNKHGLIETLLPLMPTGLHAYDMFGGSGAVSASMQASGLFKSVTYVELNYNTESMVRVLSETPASKTLNKIKHYMRKFELDKTNVAGYERLRAEVNRTRCPLGFWLLTRHAHSNLTRFNRKGEFNVSFGNRSISHRMDVVESEVNEFRHAMQDVNIVGNHYANVLNGLSPARARNSFFYFDPPYLASGAHAYGSWTEEDDRKLMSNLDRLNSVNGKWMLSNVLRHRHYENLPLIKWSKKYKTEHTCKVYNFANAQDDSYGTQEVIITNY